MSASSLLSRSRSFLQNPKKDRTLTESQACVAAIFEHPWIEGAINSLICINVLVMIVETDHNASCKTEQATCASKALEYINMGFLLIYTVEVIAKLFIHRRDFFDSKFNNLDLFIVVCGCSTFALETAFKDNSSMPNLSMLRMVRILRLMKNVRLFRYFPELHKLVEGFICAMHAMAWGLILIVMILIFFAIITVEIVHPINLDLLENNPEEMSPWCEDAFSSVFNATLLYFQTLVAGDSWGSCIVPLIRVQPMVMCIFISALACVQLGFTNLILSVVVDSAASSREHSKEKEIYLKTKQEADAVDHLREVIKECDADDSGEVTFDELKNGVSQNPNAHEILDILDIKEEDLEEMFILMDTDHSGTLSYDEFVNCIRKAEMQDMRVQMMVLSLQVSAIRDSVCKKRERNKDGSLSARVGQRYQRGLIPGFESGHSRQSGSQPGGFEPIRERTIESGYSKEPVAQPGALDNDDLGEIKLTVERLTRNGAELETLGAPISWVPSKDHPCNQLVSQLPFQLAPGDRVEVIRAFDTLSPTWFKPCLGEIGTVIEVDTSGDMLLDFEKQERGVACEEQWVRVSKKQSDQLRVHALGMGNLAPNQRQQENCPEFKLKDNGDAKSTISERSV